MPTRISSRPRTSLGRAGLTSTFLPSMWIPPLACWLSTAAVEAGSSKTTKPKPRERLVVRSCMITASLTAPNSSKNACAAPAGGAREGARGGR
eukprot:scaffold97351_cov51-Phaeocystis_antarctica.AAC.3